MQTHKSFVGLLLVVFSHFERTTVAEPCNYFNTVRFQSSEVQFVNESGVAVHKGIKYRPDQYGYYDYEFENGVKRTVKSHLRGCICAALDQNGMCIRPCNPLPIVYKVKAPGQRGQFGPAKIAFSLWMFADVGGDEVIANLADIPNYRDRFHGVKTCERVVQKEYNRIPFVQNGTRLIVDGRPELSKYNNGKFCLSVLEDEFDELSVSKWYCDNETERKRYLFVYGMFVSLPFLIATFLVYALIPELRTLHGKCMMCYLTNMIVGYCLVPMVLLKNHYDSPLCEILAYITYYTILLNFFWVNVICFDIWWTFSQFRVADRDEEDQKFLWYLIYGFGTPFILVMCEVLMDNVAMNPISPKVGANGCFFIDEGYIELVYVYTPIGLLVVSNIFFFVATAWRIRKVNMDASMARQNDTKFNLCVSFRLFIMMGILWILEVIAGVIYSFAPTMDTLFGINDILSSSQGVIVFFMYVMRKKTRNSIKDRWNTWRGNKIHPVVSLVKNQRTLSVTSSSNISQDVRYPYE